MPEPSLQDENALIVRLRAGEELSFEQVVREQGGRMLTVARRILRNETEGREAVQDAFISAFRAIGSFDGSSKLSTWLHRITVNAALMRLRSKDRRAEDSLDEIADLLPRYLADGHRADVGPEWTESPLQLAERKETREMVRACIDELPDAYRTVLLLRDIEELDTKETARLLDVNENIVKIRLHRARQALRTLLDPRMTGQRT